MKESKFIEQNKEKWLDFENLLKTKTIDPGKQSKLFVQITDDLSFARTYYRNRMVRKYLNGIAQSLFLAVNRSPRLSLKSFWNFWKIDLPFMIAEAKNEFRVSLFVFVLAMGIGFLSSYHDPEFAQLILSKGYVEKTVQNINNNDPMGVYKDFAQVEGFLKITLNNLIVACITFVMGAFMAIGTLFMMLYNGIMVGTFQYFFIERDLFKESFLTIWQHGTLEISALIIAGAAGLTLGRGMLFPGTLTRFQAFRISAKRGMKIMVGIFPVIIFAGFIEGFFTRYTQMPDLLRLGVILASLAFVVLYFVWYPIKVARNTSATLEPETVSYRPKREIDIKALYTGGQLFENTFLVLRASFRFFFWLSFGSAVLTSVSLVVQPKLQVLNEANQLIPVAEYYQYSESPLAFLANMLISAGFLAFIFFHIKKQLVKDPEASGFFHLPSILVCLVSSSILQLTFFLPQFGAIVLLIALFPMVIFASYVASYASSRTVTRYFNGIQLFFKALSIPLALYAKIVGVVFIMIILLSFDLFKMNLNYVLWNFELPGAGSHFLPTLVYGIIYHLFLFMGVSLLIVALSLSYYSVKEGITSSNLKARIQQMGTKTKVLGYERE